MKKLTEIFTLKEDYYDSAEGQKIDKSRAEKEIKKHGLSPSDPDWVEWSRSQSWPVDAQKLLAWLGY